MLDVYTTQTTRPDLCASTYYLSRFQNSYTNEHWAHAKQILRFAQGTQHFKLADVLVGYKDSGWGSDQNVFTVLGNTVSWLFRKQPTEAEYIVLSEVVCEAKWSRSLLNDMGIECVKSTIIIKDHQSCITIAEVVIKCIPSASSKQLADIMTKGLGHILFNKHRNNLNSAWHFGHRIRRQCLCNRPVIQDSFISFTL